MPDYYPGGGVMIATDAGTIYAELNEQDKRKWDDKDQSLIEQVERALLLRGLDQKKECYRIIESGDTILASGMVSALRERYGE
ncbi:MAG TPA: hypothetical protein VHZ24_06390 [Pirellulales bacterium]|jgi:hypothetical protein|nr:hypothetical protein [Pirellulales bacterium]